MPATSVLAERWLDEVILGGAVVSDVAADSTTDWSLPAGLGDVAILSFDVYAQPTATIISDAALGNLAAWARIRTASLGTVDLLGVVPLRRVGADLIMGTWDPDALTLWRQNETLCVTMPEVDTNAAATVDYSVYVKVVRVRPIETPAGPIQLVR